MKFAIIACQLVGFCLPQLAFAETTNLGAGVEWTTVNMWLNGHEKDRRAESHRWVVTVTMGAMAMAACVLLFLRFRSSISGNLSAVKPVKSTFLDKLPTAFVTTVAIESAITAVF